MKKRFLFLVLLLAALVMSAGADDKYAGQTINFLTIQPHAVASKNLASWFEQDTGAKVNVLIVPYDNVTEKAVLDVSSGVGLFDVIEYWYPGLGTLVENNVLADLTDWWRAKSAALKFDDFIPTYRDVFTMIGGKRYGIPYDGDMHLLWYNKTIFKKYNLNPPKTWDEYLKVEKTITEGEKGNNVYGAGIMGAKIPLILVGTFLSRLGSFGGSFLDANGKPVINSPEAVAALQALVNEGKYAYPKPSAVAFDELLGGWFTGKIAMAEFWTDMGAMTDDPKASSIVGQWGVVPMPKGPGPKGQVIASMNAGFGMGVSRLAPSKDVAMAFLEYTADPEVTKRYNTVVGGIDPVRWSTLSDPAYRDFVSPELADAIKAAHAHAMAWPTTSVWFKLQEPLTDNLSLALTGAKTPKQALDDTQKAWVQIIGKK